MMTTSHVFHAGTHPGAAEDTSAAFQRYYEEAGPDYAAWSPAFNMHFGFFRFGLNPFAREAMLEQMNAELLARLAPSSSTPRILDMGCGLGATLRSLSRRLPGAELTGVTLVPWQVREGNALNHTGPEANEATARIQIELADYQQTGFPAASFDGLYALESSCYADGADKSALLAEAYRLLKPGARLVLADGFLSHPDRLLGPQKEIFRLLCDCWAIGTLGEIPAVRAELERLGFTDIRIEPSQARVALSVLQVPWVTLKFLVCEVLFGERKMSRARWNNLLAPVLLPLVGKPFGPMAYFLVTATRP